MRRLLSLLVLLPVALSAQVPDSVKVYRSDHTDSTNRWFTKHDTTKIVVRDSTPTPAPVPTPVPVPAPGTKLLVGKQAVFDSRSNPVPRGYMVNAASASWGPWSVNNPINWAGGPGGIWFGGRMTGTWNELTTPWDSYHSTAAIHVAVDSAVVEGIRVHNYGDGPRFMAHNIHYFTFRGSYLTNIHDDCMEDDRLKSGLVEDNLFDGCHVGISFRAAKADQDTVTGVGDTVVIRNNLIHLVTQALTSDKPWTHSGFFKVGNVFPAKNVKLVVVDNIFRADTLNGVGSLCFNQHNMVAKASGNILVWTAHDSTGKFINYPCQLPTGFTMTRDTSVWLNAKTAWKARHPQLN